MRFIITLSALLATAVIAVPTGTSMSSQEVEAHLAKRNVLCCSYAYPLGQVCVFSLMSLDRPANWLISAGSMAARTVNLVMNGVQMEEEPKPYRLRQSKRNDSGVL